MELIFLDVNSLRPKVIEKINEYLSLSEHNKLTIGFYKNGNYYVLAAKRITGFFMT